jgi:hypothetical protein
MPYSIEKVKGGFKVFKPNEYGVKGAKNASASALERRVPFSNKPLTKKVAEKQRIAIALSEARKTGKSVSSYFI